MITHSFFHRAITFNANDGITSEPIFAEQPKDKKSEPKLRESKELSRMGTLFGTQFCYAEKPGGVEPGFRAIDCDEAFFEFLEDNLASSGNMALADLAETSSLLHTLEGKQKYFSAFINKRMDSPHPPDLIDKTIEAFCEVIKNAVK